MRCVSANRRGAMILIVCCTRSEVIFKRSSNLYAQFVETNVLVKHNIYHELRQTFMDLDLQITRKHPVYVTGPVTYTIKIIAPLLLADTVCHTSHSLLLLVQLNKLVTTAHEQTAIERATCWKLNICQFERGVARKTVCQKFATTN